MKVLVLGATGGTGREILREATAQGHSVVALVRSKAKAEGLAGAELVEGDARDEAVLSRALVGCDAVISSLGTPVSPFKEVTLLSTATRALVRAMDGGKVRRLVCITGLGAGDSRGHGGLAFDMLVMPLFLRKVYADKDRQEAVVRASDLDWVLVRPVVLNDKPAKGSVRAQTDLSDIHGGSIARADVAKFVVQQLTDDTWLRRAPLIAW
ncbi:NAD(P)-dependent oxidoreductase [Methylocapsa sp. S129]|uniref:NAD(P)-dependent oxidoreductase n=1 Tax=Methylocapsa sp. S129 TaxID=1641869 RepID=UPI00131B91B5|nr:SDR family oxidoreductase [Methylocapsa sp. S129]